jgi:hypothetical protein
LIAAAQPNPKYEFRNPKQSQMPKSQCTKHCFEFW